MNEPRQSLDRCFLVAKETGQLRLIAALLFNDRDYKGGDGFDLMTMCPRQQISDIVKDACRFDQCIHAKNMISQVVTCAITHNYKSVQTSGSGATVA
jgi:hypothetical protein